MAYSKQTWQTGDPITAVRMNKIESGIEDAHTIAENALTADSPEIDALQGSVNSLSATVNGTTSTPSLASQITDLYTRFDQQDDNGTWAADQIHHAIGETANHGSYDNLDTRITGIDLKLSQTSITATNANTQVTNAMRNISDSLVQRFLDVEDGVSSVAGALNSLTVTINNSGVGGGTLAQRLQAIDDNSTPTRHLPDVIRELTDAHGANNVHGELNDRFNTIENEIKGAHTSIALASNGVNKAYDSLDARFEAIEAELVGATDMETRIDTIAGNVNDVANNKVNKTDIANNLTTTTTGKVLDATQGKILKDAIDNLDDAYKAADTALDGRLDAIDGGSALDTTNGTLAARVAAVETIAGDAAVASTVNQALSDLDDRLDAIDSGSNTTISGIIDRLDGLDDSTNGRVKVAEDAIDTLEGTVNHETTGLAATKAIADAAKAKADTALQPADISQLNTDVNNLKNKQTSYTEVIHNATYDANGKPQINDPSEDVDYLIKGASPDTKYYYWKYIKTSTNPNVFSWELISGAGGNESSSGNTSGYDLTAAEYTAIVQAGTYAENTDYYVTQSDGLVHHYRYIMVENETTHEDELTEIEIGTVINTTNIKRYNAITSTTGEGAEQVTYLDLYEFDYGVNNTSIDPQSSTLRAHIPLPKGGGGSNNNITARLVRIGDETVSTIVNNKVNLYVFFSAWDSDQSYSGNYTLKYNNTSIDTGTFTSGAINATPINWVVVEEPTFENDAPVITSPDATKLYIVRTGDTFTQWTYDDGSWSSTNGAPAGFYALDISNYCKTASINNTFSITVNYGTNNPSLGKTWIVNVYDLYIESEAPQTLLIDSESSYGFSYTAFGALQKTLHVLVDGQQVGTKNLSGSTSGRADTFTITPTMVNDAAGYIHGVHKVEMYLTANIGNTTQTTSRIVRDYIWYDATDIETPIIIASPYRNQTLNIQQYSTLSIPYQVYQKDADSITVKYYIDNTLLDEVHLEETTNGVLDYVVTADEGEHTIKIQVEEVYIEIDIAVTELDINISPVTGAIIDFDPSTSSNSSINRLPSWTVGQTTYQFTASPNFNWSNDISGGGYKEDENHEKCFVIKAGSYIDLNYPMFANNVFTNGAEMKITFKTAAVRNADAVWYKNIGENSGKTVGIQLNAHNGWLKTDKAVSGTVLADEDSDEDTITIKGIVYTYWKPNTAYSVNDTRVIRSTIYRCTTAIEGLSTNLQDKSVDLDSDPAKSYLKKWLKIGQLDTEILSTNSYLYFPYSENDKIELDINVNKSAANNNFIMSYEDGVPSKAYAYTTGAGGDKITHNGTIRIGSDDCDVYIYRLRYYTEELSTDEILQNFIADGATIDEKVARYNRNCIYWDSTQEKYFTSPSPTAYLDPIKLAERMPNVKVLMLETPTFTTGKKDFVQGSTLRCIHAAADKDYTGKIIYPTRGDADNWFFQNGFHAGQGTTSDNYGQAGRNVDFLFEVDGKHYPTKAKDMTKYTPSLDYKSNVLIGEDASEWVETAQNSGIYHWVPTRQPEISEICSDWMEDNCKVGLTETSVPNNYFNLKVNIASSENVNNALFQKRYNDFLVYESPAQAAQIAKHHDTYENIEDVIVKNTMEFVPAVLFIRETGIGLDGNPVARNEFNDDHWHFYALGNIGDSKKSDYTRAYDPDDINEFTCENSDNNTNNGQFQSGVFTYQGHENAIETDYSAWSESIAYENGAIVVYNGMVYTRSGATQAALEENETYSWVAADWTAITYTGWVDSDPPYFAPRTNPNPMEYTYPITSSQWNVKLGNNYLNRKHMTLVTEEFDGDHSFEFRYACKGDYRDGSLINDTNGDSTISDGEGGYLTKDDVQFDLNHDVMLAMYEWLITATPEQYASEAPQWFVKSAMEYFYAYTHYYTMMDNRAKNTFWHFAKTGIHRLVSRPVEALYHIYEVADGTVTVSNGVATGNFKKPEGSFNPSGTYYTQYAFDLWAYDCDTAAGIDNNGALVFPYGKEDEDYRVDGEPSSGYAFNGAGSIFWRRLKNTFASEIANVMDTAKKCFNPEDLINEFDDFQSCFPEEIWRLDIERKYIRTYTGASIDNSITAGKQNARFLMSMMQGRKKYQRRQWIRDQSFYFNSKYNIGEVAVNKTEFNIVSPAGQQLAVQPDYHLRLTPYQDMYLNVVVGGTSIPPIRAKAGQEYTIKLDDYTAGNFSETRVYIGGFRMISKLGGLAPMYPYSFTLNGLDHLKELDVGTDDSGYRNGNFTELPLTNEINLPLLETLNIKNCNALATSIGLRTANNLRVVEAVGSTIGGISLPEYSRLEILHLPSTVTDITIHGARFLKDFIVADRNGTENYSNIYTLDISDSDYSINFKEDPSDPLPVDWLDIAIEVLEKQSSQTNLSLVGLYSATIGDIQDIDTIAEAKETIEVEGGQVNLEGIINVTGEWSSVEKAYYGKPSGIWPKLDFNVDANNEVVRYKVIYKYDATTYDGREIYSTYVTPTPGNDYITIEEIYSNQPGVTSILSTAPDKPSTKEYYYTFGTIGNNGYYSQYTGWRLVSTGNMLTNATANIDINSIDSSNTVVVEAIFNSSLMSYPIYWYLNKNDATPAYIAKDNLNNPITVQYGKNYDGHIPTVQDLTGKTLNTMTASGSNITYKIFDGWASAPINLTLTDEEAAEENPAYKIYAKWRSGIDVPLATIRDSVEYTPEKLLLFSKFSALRTNETYFSTNKRFDITLGYDGVSDGIQITPFESGGANYIDVFSSNNTRNTNISPLSSENNAFTLVLDYQFDLSHNYGDAEEAVLAGCYESRNGAIYGFRLYYDPYEECVKVGFGNTRLDEANHSKIITDAKASQYRNIIVLRHAHNDPVLYIYSGIRVNNGYGLNDSSNMEILNNLDADNFVQTLEWSNISTEAKLIFGALSASSVSDNQITRGYGKIYWAKYWNKDLGAGECRMLAAWPHETITFGVEDYAENSNRIIPTIEGITQPNIILTALSTSQYIGPIYKTLSGNTYNVGDLISWNNSWYRTFSNNRIFYALPITLQSILNKTTSVSKQIRCESGGIYNIVGGNINSQDYIFLPSYAEVDRSDDTWNAEANRKYAWNINSSATIYTYNIDNHSFSTSGSNDNTSSYMNLRFPYKSIGLSNRIFTNYDDSATVYSKINSITNITRGDIFTLAGSSVAFIYVDENDIQNGAPVVPNSGIFACTRGGWIRSECWWLRSVFKGPITSSSAGLFMFVKPIGLTSNVSMEKPASLSNYNSASSDNIASSAQGACLCYSFGV